MEALQGDHFFASNAALGALTNTLRAWWTDLHTDRGDVGRGKFKIRDQHAALGGGVA